MTENDDTQTQQPQDDPGPAWGKMVNDLWGPLFKQWGGMFQSNEHPESIQFKGRVGETIQSAVKMWQVALDAMSDPAALQHFQNATRITPDIALGFARNCLSSFTSLHSHFAQWVEKRNASLSEADIQELDKEFVKKLSQAYEEEFSQYFKFPQIGLTRFYQERALHAADKMNALQGVLAEFLKLLAEPVEKSLNSLQGKMVEMTKAGPLDEKSKTYYNLWIRLLEGHYMELFKRPEYSEALSKTLEALNQYMESRQLVVNDLLKQFNVPTHQDLDDLYKEIYLLKKRMRSYEKRS